MVELKKYQDWEGIFRASHTHWRRLFSTEYQGEDRARRPREERREG